MSFRSTDALQSRGLRAPLENGVVTVSRAKGTCAFPARFQLIAAMNPCPCGRLGTRSGECLCTKPSIQNYLKKLSQPILERIDLHVQLEAVPMEVITSQNAVAERPEEQLRAKVLASRKLQHARLGCPNSFARGEEVKKFEVAPSAFKLLERAAAKGNLSARGFTRVLRVARTIADLEECVHVEEPHIAEAIGFQSLDMIQRYCAAA